MHLYSILDSQPDQDSNRGLPYLGRIFLEDHMACSALFEIARREGCAIHPFEDVRLTSQQVQRLVEIFRTPPQGTVLASPEWARIMDVLAVPVETKAGVLSFCD